jgi:hypothetical protein
MNNFTTFCAFPIYCKACDALRSTNMFALPLTCSNCGSGEVTPYDDSSLIAEPGASTVVEWNMEGELGRRLALTDGTYFCPKCRNFTLRFSPGSISWD